MSTFNLHERVEATGRFVYNFKVRVTLTSEDGMFLIDLSPLNGWCSSISHSGGFPNTHGKVPPPSKSSSPSLVNSVGFQARILAPFPLDYLHLFYCLVFRLLCPDLVRRTSHLLDRKGPHLKVAISGGTDEKRAYKKNKERNTKM